MKPGCLHKQQARSERHCSPVQWGSPQAMCARRAGRHRVGGAGALPSRQQPNEQSGSAEKRAWLFTWLQYFSSLVAGTAHRTACCGLLGSRLAPEMFCPTHRHKSEEVSPSPLSCWVC